MIGKVFIISATALGLIGCIASDAASVDENAPVTETPIENLNSGDPSFEQVLAEYQAYNERLDRIAGRLRLANAYLCPATEPDPGFTVHTINDYPAHMVELARTMLGLEGDGYYVRSVREGSPADAAQIRAGDQVLTLNGFSMPRDGVAQAEFYAAMIRQAYADDIARLSLKTPQGQFYPAEIKPQAVCAIPAHVYYSDDINGHTDGQEVLITSEMMQTVEDDVSLALIIGHEMAHVIAGHNAKMPTKNLELVADRMALVMLENAGYDIDAAINYWRDAAHPHRIKEGNTRSHPGIEARYLNFNTERLRIRRLQALGQDLVFMTIPNQ